MQGNKHIFALVAVLVAGLSLLLFGETMFGSARPPSDAESSNEVSNAAKTEPELHMDESGAIDRESLALPVTLLHGTVHDASGKPWRDGIVQMRHLRFGDWDEEATLAQRRTTTDARGGFRFADGDPGSVAVELLVEGRVVLRRDVHAPRSGALALRLDAQEAESEAESGRKGTAALTVTVFEPDGRLASDVAGSLFAGPHSLPIDARTDERGRLQFHELAAGNYVTTAASASGSSPIAKSGVASMNLNAFGRVATRLLEGEQREIRLQLQTWAKVAGRCVDERGDAVAGARVQLLAKDASFRRELVADAAGEFVTRIHPGRAYQLFEAARSGFHMPMDDSMKTFPRLAPGEKRLDHVIRCRRPVPVRLRFSDEQKRPLPGVVLVSSSPPGVSLSSNSRDYMIGEIEPRRSDAKGRISFDAWPGSYFFLFAHARGYLSASVYFDIRGLDGKDYAAQIERAITLQPLPGGTIEGHVVDDSGHPVEGAKVRAMVGKEHVHYMSAGHMQSYQPSNAVTALSNESGEFVLAGLDRKSVYNIHCKAPGHMDSEKTGARTGRRVRFELEVPAELRGRVTLPSGLPVVDAIVTLGSYRSGTDAEGRFSVKRAERGKQRLYVQSPTIYDTSITVDKTTPRDRSITVQSRLVLVGRLLDPNGRPMALTRVKLRLRKKWSNHTVELATDQAGRYRFFWPGYRRDESPRDVFVDHGSVPSRDWCQLLASKFDPKQPPDRLQFRAGKSMTVRVLGPDGRPIQGMFLSVANGMGRVSPQDADGRYRLSALPSDKVRVHLHASYLTASGARFVDLVVGGPEPTITARKKPGEK